MTEPLSFLDPISFKPGKPTPAEGAVSRTFGVADRPLDLDWLKKNIPCQAACPAGTDIPGYLEAVSRKDYLEAYRINLRDNVFPAVLGRVCTRPCEPACRHGWTGLGEPVAICFAKRSASDFSSRDEPMVLEPVFPSSGKRVAVIGAGAAGLAAARELTLLGHEVVVYEKGERAGGLMVQGIPEFRLPRDVVEKEIANIQAQGVEIRCGQAVESVEALRAISADFDSVVLAFGASKPVFPDLEGLDFPGVDHGVNFLRNVNQGARPDVGKDVVVIGGGFTAVDCSRMAKRLGAERVSMRYRRSVHEMYISKHELVCMKNEDISFHTHQMPTAIQKTDDGRLCIDFQATRILPGKPGERSSIELDDRKAPESVIVDTLLLGTGQTQDWSWLPGDLKQSLMDQTSAGLFLAGDAFTGPGSLIDAIGHAKSVARNVDAALMGVERLAEVAYIEDMTRTGRTRAMDKIPRQAMPEIPAASRTVEAEVEQGLSEEAGIEEAKRCYLCNIKFEIDNELCIYCDRCLKVKPVDTCIVKVKDLIRDEDGRITGYEEAKNNREYNLLYIDQSQCIRCGACAEVCPVECISLQRVSRKTVKTKDMPWRSSS